MKNTSLTSRKISQCIYCIGWLKNVINVWRKTHYNVRNYTWIRKRSRNLHYLPIRNWTLLTLYLLLKFYKNTQWVILKFKDYKGRVISHIFQQKFCPRNIQGTSSKLKSRASRLGALCKIYCFECLVAVAYVCDASFKHPCPFVWF